MRWHLISTRQNQIPLMCIPNGLQWEEAKPTSKKVPSGVDFQSMMLRYPARRSRRYLNIHTRPRAQSKARVLD